MAAYAAATSTTTSFEMIQAAATGDDGEQLSKDAARPYRAVLERLLDKLVLAIEVKLKRTIKDDDTRNLHWLEEQIGDELLDAIVITTGDTAYRRPDGIGVVPAALLGP
jgi:hypothetical protein